MNDPNPNVETEASEEEGKVRIRPDLDRYVRDKSGNGKRTHRTDDFIARSLAGKTIDEIKAAAGQLGVEYAKWEGLNIGQQRMLIGNKLRHFMEGAKPKLTEEQVTEVLGEPVAPYVAGAEGEETAEGQDETGETEAAPAAVEQPAAKAKKTVRKKK